MHTIILRMIQRRRRWYCNNDMMAWWQQQRYNANNDNDKDTMMTTMMRWWCDPPRIDRYCDFRWSVRRSSRVIVIPTASTRAFLQWRLIRRGRGGHCYREERDWWQWHNCLEREREREREKEALKPGTRPQRDVPLISSFYFRWADFFWWAPRFSLGPQLVLSSSGWIRLLCSDQVFSLN